MRRGSRKAGDKRSAALGRPFRVGTVSSKTRETDWGFSCHVEAPGKRVSPHIQRYSKAHTSLDAAVGSQTSMPLFPEPRIIGVGADLVKRARDKGSRHSLKPAPGDISAGLVPAPRSHGLDDVGRYSDARRARDLAHTRRSRRELPTTHTELRAIAAAANTGLSRIPNTGYRIPAATGIPRLL